MTERDLDPECSRFNEEHIAAWREDGFLIIPDFFSADEISPILADYQQIYAEQLKAAGKRQPLNLKEDGSIGISSREQFRNIDILPYPGSPAINLISLHPALIELAKALLGVSAVHLYQSHTWAKFTGDADYDQNFHCDFGNHTLTVPSDDPGLRSVDFILYFTDVTDDLGALHYVTKPDAYEILGEGRIGVRPEMQRALKQRERSAASPAGTIVAHGIDTFHRGTNLTRPGGHRFTMTAGYKAAGNDMIGYSVWQVTGERPWATVINHASPEQLACLGIPLPGDPYWTQRTLALTQSRWPDWDMRPYFQAST